MATTSVMPLSRERGLPLGHTHASGKTGILIVYGICKINVQKAWTETMHVALISSLGMASHLLSTPHETPNVAPRNESAQ